MSPVRSHPPGQHDFLRFLGALPVALHDLRPLDANLTDFTDRQLMAIIVDDHYFGRRQRQADRAREL